MPDTKINVSADVEIVKIPAEKIHANEWNPNELSDAMFNRLVSDVQNIGFLQPVLVTPEQDGTYRIIDGEHRYECAKLLDMPEIPCVVVSGEFAEDETKQKFQTMRMNMIRGNVDKRKLAALVSDLTTKLPIEEIAEGFAYDDVDSLRALIEDTRKSLPAEMRQEFDKAKEEIKTVDDLSLVLNRLFTKYGSTLPYNYMILDFGGKEHIWVRMPSKDALMEVRKHAALARDNDVTFSSLVLKAFEECCTKEFIENHIDDLEIVEPEEREEQVNGENNSEE